MMECDGGVQLRKLSLFNNQLSLKIVVLTLLLALSCPCYLKNCAGTDVRNSQTQLTPEDTHETAGTDVLWPLIGTEH